MKKKLLLLLIIVMTLWFSCAHAASIKLGSTGSDVTKLQTTLAQLGYYKGNITGHAGEKTVAAIKAFQKKYGLTQDGIAGPATLGKIYSLTGDSSEKQSDDADDTKPAASSGSSLKYGSTGKNVSALQENLKALGYYYGSVTGHYGNLTKAAVRKFQRASGLTADGIAGKKTIAALQEAVANQKEKGSGDEAKGSAGAILDLHWFDEKSFYTSHGIKSGLTITVMDVSTGKMFNARVQSTGSHADVEPKTAEDTEIMCDIYGVDSSEDIGFKRRAVLVKARVNGVVYTYAASMYGEAHGSQTITNNNYDGQFCIHFRHSTTSGTKVEHASNQSPIDTAVSYAVKKLNMEHVTDPDQL